jgi:Domain of unknown function DUF29
MNQILYDQDFYAWTQEQASLLRNGNLKAIDIEHLAEEIEDMGRSEKRETVSRLEILLMHLLKWQFQPNLRSRSWQSTIKEQRIRLKEHLDENPSLKATLPTILEKAYRLAIIVAERETGLAVFSDRCTYTIEQIFDPEFLPGDHLL